MDPAEARRQAQTLDALRRLEDIVADTNRQGVRLEGILRKTIERQQALEAIANAVASLALEGWFASFSDDARVRLIRHRLDDLGFGDAGVREPAPPAPESPGDAIAQDYAESAE